MATHKKKGNSRPKKAAISRATAQQQLHLQIEDFFSQYHFKEVEDHLWNWLTAGIACKHSIYDNAVERSNLLFFYQNMRDLIHGMWQLQSAPQKNRF
jgi:hypothetical protein